MLKVLLGCLAGVVLLLGGAAKPSSGISVAYEDVSYGYEGDPYDGYLGPDESLYWVLEGSLLPGQSYTYTYTPPGGQPGALIRPARYYNVRAYNQRGPDVPILVTIEQVDGLGLHRAEGIGKSCLWTEGGDYGTWQVTITSVGTRIARAVYSSGMNQSNFGQGCG